MFITRQRGFSFASLCGLAPSLTAYEAEENWTLILYLYYLYLISHEIRYTFLVSVPIHLRLTEQEWRSEDRDVPYILHFTHSIFNLTELHPPQPPSLILLVEAEEKWASRTRGWKLQAKETSEGTKAAKSGWNLAQKKCSWGNGGKLGEWIQSRTVCTHRRTHTHTYRQQYNAALLYPPSVELVFRAIIQGAAPPRETGVSAVELEPDK